MLLDLETTLARLISQPRIEFIATDGAEGEAAFFFCAHPKAFAAVIEMRPIHVIMRHFPAVQSQGIQHPFSIRKQPASTQFRARMVGFFQEKRTTDHLRRDLGQVQRGGNSGRTCAYNDQVKTGWAGHGAFRISRT